MVSFFGINLIDDFSEARLAVYWDILRGSASEISFLWSEIVKRLDKKVEVTIFEAFGLDFLPVFDKRVEDELKF